MPKVLNLLQKFDKNEGHNKFYRLLREAMTNPNNNWNRLITSLYTDIDEGYRKKTFENMIVNFIGGKRLGQNSEKYDCTFLAFTNGTMIDEAFADDVLRVKNFVPAISIKGYEEDTDFRRGKGTYRAVLKAMEIMRNKSSPSAPPSATRGKTPS